MFYPYPFDSLTGFSKLFVDFLVNRTSFFQERFPSNSKLFGSVAFIEQRAKNFRQRVNLLTLIQNSCDEIVFSNEQLLNFALLSKDNTFAVVAGQQPGFLGGPLFVLYKSLSAIHLCYKLKEIFPDFNFVPIFWVEDNDHDTYEVSQIYSFDFHFEPVRLACCSDCRKTDRVPISKKCYNEEIEDIIEYFLTLSNGFELNPELSSFLTDTYKKGEGWSSSFLKVLNYFLCDYGVLFVRSSIAREKGMLSQIIQKEIGHFGYSNSLVETANALIEAYGYHIQAKTSVVNAFYHQDNERHKILWNPDKSLFQIGQEFLNHIELIQLFENESINFSPNVLLRPICQDLIIPNVASIVGPSELGYSTQLKELYQWFGVDMPAVVPRHSATILLNSLINNQIPIKEVGFYFQPISNIESALFRKLRSKEIQEIIDNSYSNVKKTFDELRKAAIFLDKSLERSADSHLQKIINILEAFEAKIVAAEKRSLIKEFEPHKQINSFLYPNGSLQERMVTLLFPFSLFKRSEFFEKISEIFHQPNNAHYVISL